MYSYTMDDSYINVVDRLAISFQAMNSMYMDVSQYITGEMRIASHHVHILPNNAQYAKLRTSRPGAFIAIASVIIGTAEDTTPGLL